MAYSVNFDCTSAQGTSRKRKNKQILAGHNVHNQANATIQDLNDDCLMEILSYLNVIDLSSAADVCQCFKWNASYVFSHQFKQFDLRIVYQAVKLLHVGNVLLQFGGLIDTLIAAPYKSIYTHKKFTFDCILRYCGKTLKQLELRNFKINSNMLTHSRTLLGCLEVLKLDHCDLSNTAVMFFEQLKNVKRLHISNMKIPNNGC